MAKFKVVLSASYTITADNEADAINEAVNELADECLLPIFTIVKLFGSNVEEIEESLDL